MTDKWTDNRHMERQRHGKMMLLSKTLAIRRSDVASFVEFSLVD